MKRRDAAHRSGRPSAWWRTAGATALPSIAWSSTAWRWPGSSCHSLQQHDRGAHRLTSGGFPPARPRIQLGTLVIAQFYANRFTSRHSLLPLRRQGEEDAGRCGAIGCTNNISKSSQSSPRTPRNCPMAVNWYNQKIQETTCKPRCWSIFVGRGSAAVCRVKNTFNRGLKEHPSKGRRNSTWADEISALS